MRKVWARFFKFVAVQSNGCWLWTGGLSGKGTHRYAQFSIKGVLYYSHRLTYEWFVGPIPEGLVLDHTCRTPHCVNPAHVEPVTQLENVRRGKLLLMFCKRGHPMTSENTYSRMSRGYHVRQCKTCAKERAAARRAA